MIGKIKKFVLPLLMLTLLVAALVGCDVTPDRVFEENTVSNAAPVASLFVAVDINPSVEMVVDQYGNVMSVYGANEDAKLLLWEEAGIVDAKLSSAVAKIISLCQNYGYIDENTQAVNVSVYTHSSDKRETVREYIAAAIDYASNGTIDVVYDRSLSYDGRAEDGDEGKFRLINRICEAESVNSDSLEAMTDWEILELARKAQCDSDEKLGKVYDRAVKEAQFALDSVRRSLEDGVYISYLTAKSLDSVLLHPLEAMQYAQRAFHAGLYSVARSMQFTLIHYRDAAIEYAEDPLISQEDLQTVYNAMKEFVSVAFDDFKECVKDAEGKFPLSNVKEFFRKLYLSVPEQVTTAFRETYNKTIGAIKADLTEFAIKYDVKEKIRDIWTNVKNGALNALADIAQLFDDAMDTLGLKNLDFEDIFDIDVAIAGLQTAIDNEYAKMEMTDEDLIEMAQYKSEIKASLNEAKQAFTDAVKEAKRIASEWYGNAKEALKDNA